MNIRGPVFGKITSSILQKLKRNKEKERKKERKKKKKKKKENTIISETSQSRITAGVEIWRERDVRKNRVGSDGGGRQP